MPFTADGIWLPFTYPPFAAMMFRALGLMSPDRRRRRRHGDQLPADRHHPGGDPARPGCRDRPGAGGGATALAAVVIWTNPFWMTLGFGRINVILMAMVVADVFLLGARTSRPDSPWRGVLVGLAAAIKLTPAVFGLVFTAQHRWRGRCLRRRLRRRRCDCLVVAARRFGRLLDRHAPEHLSHRRLDRRHQPEPERAVVPHPRRHLHAVHLLVLPRSGP